MKTRVLLLYTRHLLGESLEKLLRDQRDIHLLGPWVLDAQAFSRVASQQPDLVLIAEDEAVPEQVARLTAQILETYPNLPVIHSTLTRNVVRIYTSQELPARSADLIEAIRALTA
ncbi:MAG: hypothetical protein PHS96_01075 [Anaerolineales bacterium]|nr:hypothetical protein [Anaerolineales bacterium]